MHATQAGNGYKCDDCGGVFSFERDGYPDSETFYEGSGYRDDISEDVYEGFTDITVWQCPNGCYHMREEPPDEGDCTPLWMCGKCNALYTIERMAVHCCKQAADA